jgi:DNA-binding Lrp family transcriptional regulator
LKVQSYITENRYFSRIDRRLEKEEIAVKDVELRLITELMKDSRRSDRELAKTLNVSQPTITRTRKKLEKEGYIKEYTIIPDFEKLGLQMMSFTAAKLKKQVSEDAIRETREKLRKTLPRERVSTILTMRGIGLSADYMIIAVHESYHAYLRFLDLIKRQPILEVTETRSFIASLTENQFRPLTFSTLAEYVARMKMKENPKA